MKFISAEQFFRCGDTPIWRRLIDRPLTKDERVSLIADLISDRSKIQEHTHLNKGDAQSVVDMIDEVPLRTHVRMAGLLT